MGDVTIICKGCKEPFTVTEARFRSVNVESCSNECRYGKPDPQAAIDRFWARVDRSGGPDACWPWTGKSTMRYGYGLLTWKQRLVNAARLAYELVVGPIPAGLDLLHSCDNPPCCNPKHLRPGTHMENMIDMDTRKRGANQFGPRRKYAAIPS